MLRRTLHTALVAGRHARTLASETTSSPADKWRLVSVDRSRLVGVGGGDGGGTDDAVLPPGYEDTPLLKHLEALIKASVFV